jgi:hypothetical protein
MGRPQANGSLRAGSGTFALLLALLFLAGCSPVTLVAPYDEFIYEGLTDFKESLNNHVKNMADLAGTPEGTHAANRISYNTLETRIEILIDRAALQASGNRCSVPGNLAKAMDEHLRDQLPDTLTNAPVEASPNTFGCKRRLLELVRDQLVIIEEIHRDLDRCPAVDAGDSDGSAPEAVTVSCLRPATAADALAIANQSIDAAWYLENAKRQG